MHKGFALLLASSVAQALCRKEEPGLAPTAAGSTSSPSGRWSSLTECPLNARLETGVDLSFFLSGSTSSPSGWWSRLRRACSWCGRRRTRGFAPARPWTARARSTPSPCLRLLPTSRRAREARCGWRGEGRKQGRRTAGAAGVGSVGSAHMPVSAAVRVALPGGLGSLRIAASTYVRWRRLWLRPRCAVGGCEAERGYVIVMLYIDYDVYIIYTSAALAEAEVRCGWV
jgi:hypothetical protein